MEEYRNEFAEIEPELSRQESDWVQDVLEHLSDNQGVSMTLSLDEQLMESPPGPAPPRDLPG